MQRNNVRFWVWWADGPVKLTLRPGQSLSASSYARTDEGWCSEHSQWTHEGDRVLRESGTDGRDCDGRLSTFSDCECSIDNLHSFEPFRHDDECSCCQVDAGIRYPAWERVNAGQRDYSAEAMGY